MKNMKKVFMKKVFLPFGLLLGVSYSSDIPLTIKKNERVFKRYQERFSKRESKFFSELWGTGWDDESLLEQFSTGSEGNSLGVDSPPIRSEKNSFNTGNPSLLCREPYTRTESVDNFISTIELGAIIGTIEFHVIPGLIRPIMIEIFGPIKELVNNFRIQSDGDVLKIHPINPLVINGSLAYFLKLSEEKTSFPSIKTNQSQDYPPCLYHFGIQTIGRHKVRIRALRTFETFTNPSSPLLESSGFDFDKLLIKIVMPEVKIDFSETPLNVGIQNDQEYLYQLIREIYFQELLKKESRKKDILFEYYLTIGKRIDESYINHFNLKEKSKEQNENKRKEQGQETYPEGRSSR
jgi:hypothetical protein